MINKRILDKLYNLKKYALLETGEIVRLYDDPNCSKPKRIVLKNGYYYLYQDEPVIDEFGLRFFYVGRKIIATSDCKPSLINNKKISSFIENGQSMHNYEEKNIPKFGKIPLGPAEIYHRVVGGKS